MMFAVSNSTSSSATLLRCQDQLLVKLTGKVWNLILADPLGKPNKTTYCKL